MLSRQTYMGIFIQAISSEEVSASSFKYQVERKKRTMFLIEIISVCNKEPFAWSIDLNY